MSLCASCGLQLSGDASLCPIHHCVYGDNWAAANRIWCDFVHRGKVPTRDTWTDEEWEEHREYMVEAGLVAPETGVPQCATTPRSAP